MRTKLSVIFGFLFWSFNLLLFMQCRYCPHHFDFLPCPHPNSLSACLVVQMLELAIFLCKITLLLITESQRGQVAHCLNYVGQVPSLRNTCTTSMDFTLKWQATIQRQYV